MREKREDSEQEFGLLENILQGVFLVWLSGMLVYGFIGFIPDAQADERGHLTLAAGVGYHNKTLDGPEFVMDNPLGIVELEYQRGPWAFTLRHTSSMLVFEQGWGANVAEIKYLVTLF